MGEIVDATWRAAAYSLHPRTLLWSLLPLAVVGGLVFALGWYGWAPAVAGMHGLLDRSDLLAALVEWLQSFGLPDPRPLLAPVIVVALVQPALVMACLLLVDWLMAPAMVDWIVRRRFPALARAQGAAGRWGALGWSLSCALFALLALVLSVPLWFVPPLVLVLPPLIWGWLCHRVMAFDVLAGHAGADERRLILYLYRWPLRLAGLLCGLSCTLPALLWVQGLAVQAQAPWVLLLAVWLYTVLFSFASLWFAHYMLAALHRLRQATAAVQAQPQARLLDATETP